MMSCHVYGEVWEWEAVFFFSGGGGGKDFKVLGVLDSLLLPEKRK